MVFCNTANVLGVKKNREVTILILIDGFLQFYKLLCPINWDWVTILILIDGFLQLCCGDCSKCPYCSHNPYFNRWFSAIAAKISQNFTFLCKKLVFSDSFCELYFTQPLYINYCTNYLNTFLLKLAKIKAIINII